MAVMLFAYRKGSTPMHRAGALLKIALLTILCICTFSGSTTGTKEFLARTSPCLAASLLAFIIAGARPNSLRQLLFVPVMGLFVTAFSAVSFSGAEGTEAAVISAGFIAISREGLLYGLQYTLRFFITALAAQSVFETTSATEITEALESVQDALARVLPPLKKYNLALPLALTLSFIPQVFSTWNRVHLAALARSGRPKGFHPVLLVRTASAELQALLSSMLFQAETKRKALLNRSAQETEPAP